MSEPANRSADGPVNAPEVAVSGAMTAVPPPSGQTSIGGADGTVPASAGLLPPPPIGADGKTVRVWSDEAGKTAEPEMDGTLGAERKAAEAFQRMAKAANTRAAYRSAVRAGCA